MSSAPRYWSPRASLFSPNLSISLRRVALPTYLLIFGNRVTAVTASDHADVRNHCDSLPTPHRATRDDADRSYDLAVKPRSPSTSPPSPETTGTLPSMTSRAHLRRDAIFRQEHGEPLPVFLCAVGSRSNSYSAPLIR